MTRYIPSYTGYPGGQREITPTRLQAKPNGDDKFEKSNKG